MAARSIQDMITRLKWRRSKITLGSLLLVVAGIALTVGLFGFAYGGFEGDDGRPEDQLGELGASPTPRAPPPPTPTAAPTPTPTPAPSEALPARMVIDKIGVDAPIITLGLDPDAVPEVPNKGDTLAWYDFSSKPRHGGNSVFSGHVGWNFEPAVLWELKNLEEGDVIHLELEDGTEYQYRVKENLAIEWDDPEAVQSMLPTPEEVITLITCGGTWVPNPSQRYGGNYTHRVMVRAEPVPDSDAIAASPLSVAID